MRGMVSASPPTTTICSSIQSKTQTACYCKSLNSVTAVPRTLSSSSDLKLKGLRFRGGARAPHRVLLQCNSSTKPGPPSSSGDGDSKTVLDAFFLGKALAEALNERLESAVGEFLSTVGRLQSEQQKQVQEFQDDVFERAKKAKEKAARQAREARGLVPKSSTVNATSVTVGSSSTASPSTIDIVTPASSSSVSDPTTLDSETDSDSDTN